MSLLKSATQRLLFTEVFSHCVCKCHYCWNWPKVSPPSMKSLFHIRYMLIRLEFPWFPHCVAARACSDELARSCDLRMLPPAFSSMLNVDCTSCCTRFRLTSQSEVGPSAKKKICRFTRLNVSRNVRVSVKHARRLSLHANFESRVDKGMKRLIKDTAPSLTLKQLAKMVRKCFWMQNYGTPAA